MRVTKGDFSPLIKITEQYKSDLHDVNASWQRSKSRLAKEFRAKWFIHRAIVPVSVVSGISSDEIFSDTRTRDTFNARALVMWIAYQSGSIGYASIGRVIARDHSTVRHAIQVVDNNLTARRGGVYEMLVDVCDLEDQWH